MKLWDLVNPLLLKHKSNCSSFNYSKHWDFGHSKMKNNSLYRIKKMVLIALMTALLSAGKFALIALPNVEIVTISIITGTYVFGLSVLLPATLIFSAIETSIWGFAPWVVSYFVYWPLLAVVTYLMKALITKNKVIFPSIIGCLMSAFFGVITTFVDSLFYSSGNNFSSFFSAMYIRGIYFFLIQVISNTVLLAVLFLPLEKVLSMLRDKYYSNWKIKKPKIDYTKENQRREDDTLNEGETHSEEDPLVDEAKKEIPNIDSTKENGRHESDTLNEGQNELEEDPLVADNKKETPILVSDNDIKGSEG